jgi:hypothetical protein
MGVSINPFEFLKVMKEKRDMNRAQVIDWLESLREDARLLAETWMNIAEQLETSRDAANLGDDLTELRTRMTFQLSLASRVQEFYNLATMASGGRVVQDIWQGFIRRLGNVLYQREITRKETEALLLELRTRYDASLLDSKNDLKRLMTVRDAASLLQREFAALDVFIQTIKAAPKAFN